MIDYVYLFEIFMKKFISLAGLCLGVANAQTIPDSYIVTFKPSGSSASSVIVPTQDNSASNAHKEPFGEHKSGQSKDDLRQKLKIKGQVNKIFDRINAAHLNIDVAEADKLKRDPRVLSVEPNRLVHATSTQLNSGWALDRMDQTYTVLNNQYNYQYDGSNRTIYILDTGLNVGNANVANEFLGRSQIIYDVNGGNGYDCHGHGTQVASAAAGKTYGTAKNANIIIGKISFECTKSSDVSVVTSALNWLANNAKRGSIVNLSFGTETCDFSSPALENAIRAVHDAGVIFVASAGNNRCNTAFSSFTRLPQAFVVGATQDSYLYTFQKDLMADFTHYGTNVAGFAPGVNVPLMGRTGTKVFATGTSFAAPYVAGLFASGCHAMGAFCDTITNAGVAYQALKNTALMGSVVTANNSTSLPAGTPSRFFIRNAW